MSFAEMVTEIQTAITFTEWAPEQEHAVARISEMAAGIARRADAIERAMKGER